MLLAANSAKVSVAVALHFEVKHSDSPVLAGRMRFISISASMTSRISWSSASTFTTNSLVYVACCSSFPIFSFRIALEMIRHVARRLPTAS